MSDERSSGHDLNRRHFFKAGSFATVMAAMGGIPLTAQEAAKLDSADGKVLPPPKVDPNYKEKPPGPPVRCGVVGLGTQGRDILTTLAKLPNGPVTAICDNYKAAFRRAAEAAPNAKQHADYRELIANPEVQAVIVATPTHLHREIAVAAMQAGKHVYVEAPLAHSIDDARAIAAAAKGLAKGQVFQAGLQLRENPQHHHVLKFVRTAATGRIAVSRGQYNRKQSWRRSSPNGDRERALNWRLYKDTSIGLPGEIGIHSLDTACWFNDKVPVAVSGFGASSSGRTIVKWPIP